MKKIIFLNVLLLLIVTLTFFSCSKESPNKSEPTLAEELQEVLDNALSVYNIKGISAAVIIPDQYTWYGVSGLSHGSTPIVSGMLFRIGSITKNYVAALVLRLADEGILNLEDSLAMWLPIYPNIDGDITIRQLLNHTSGIYNIAEHPTIWNMAQTDPYRYWSPEEVITNFVRVPYFSPGTGWYYSNTNYLLLGMIIKQATQSELSTGLKQCFFDSLGLSHTFFAGEEDISGEMAHGWYDINQDGILDDFSDIPRIAIDSLGWGAGGLVATAEDVAQWASHLFNGEVLASNSLEEMVTFISLFSSPSTTGYGLGTYRFNFFGKTLWGHTGGDVDFSSVVLFLPEDGATFVVLINQVEQSVATIASGLLNAYLNWRQN